MGDEISELRHEVERLRRRVTELEGQDTERQRSLLAAFFEHTPAMMIAVELEGRILFTNPEIESYFNRKREDLLGRSVYEVLSPKAADTVRAANTEVAALGTINVSEQRLPTADGERVVLSTKFPIRDASGVIFAVGTIAMDITREKQAEAEREAIHAKLIEMQRAMIQELATPLLPLAAGVIAMPIVGAVDAARAAQLLETLLDGISTRCAEIAILDITGVKVVDTHVAQTLVNAAQAAKLLGACMVVTGIKPQIATTLIALGADLRGVVTESTLEAGIAYAFKHRRKGA